MNVLFIVRSYFLTQINFFIKRIFIQYIYYRKPLCLLENEDFIVSHPLIEVTGSNLPTAYLLFRSISQRHMLTTKKVGKPSYKYSSWNTKYKFKVKFFRHCGRKDDPSVFYIQHSVLETQSSATLHINSSETNLISCIVFCLNFLLLLQLSVAVLLWCRSSFVRIATTHVVLF